ncbi:CERCAM [Symbiodinium pilosum]|uniref:CERCAM protein n=1 Tax=Symbiodinium pilosum TaxID=2952 RepID=A0A812SZ39_SYMPI|nr:CERCAM [Symbiodinium pilosum]
MRLPRVKNKHAAPTQVFVNDLLPAGSQLAASAGCEATGGTRPSVIRDAHEDRLARQEFQRERLSEVPCCVPHEGWLSAPGKEDNQEQVAEADPSGCSCWPYQWLLQRVLLLERDMSFTPSCRQTASSRQFFARTCKGILALVAAAEDILLQVLEELWALTTVVQNFEWVNTKRGPCMRREQIELEHDDVWRVSKARLQHWPRLDEQHIHEVSFGSRPQRFCKAADAELLGDPMDNIFIINLPRRPAKLKHVLAQLHGEGLNAKIVDAIDGDLNVEVEHSIPSALILEDDFDLQDGFKERLGSYLEEARDHDWNLMYLGRSPTEPDICRISQHLAQPGYTLWTVGYIFKLDAARALVQAEVEKRLAPLDHYFSVAMGQGFSGHWNENAVEWSQYIPQVLRGLAITPPLVMPYVGSMFLSDTAMLRSVLRQLVGLRQS